MIAKFALNENDDLRISRNFAPVDSQTVVDAILACGFDPQSYLDANPDLIRAQLLPQEALVHFLVSGITERRRAPIGPSIEPIASAANLRFSNPSARFELVATLLANRNNHPSAQQEIWNSNVHNLGSSFLSAGLSPFVLIGDSHSHAYAEAYRTEVTTLVPLHLLCSGGSALGLGNPNSKSKYGQRILALAAHQKEAFNALRLPLFLKFGQVDAEFVWIFRRIKESRMKADMEEFEEFAKESVSSYARFLADLLALGVHPDILRVCAIFPPCLSNEQWSQGYVNAHIGFLESDQSVETLSEGVKRLQIPSLFARTNMHSYYNSLLQGMCSRLGLLFLDDFSPLVSGAGVVRQELVSGHLGRDHHLPWDGVRREITPMLARYMVTQSLGTSPF